MTDCPSVRGTWGQPCPDCGQRLPNPPPLRSWHSQRQIDRALSAASSRTAPVSGFMPRKTAEDGGVSVRIGLGPAAGLIHRLGRNDANPALAWTVCGVVFHRLWRQWEWGREPLPKCPACWA